MAEIVKDGKLTLWIDGEGNKVPVKYVPAADKDRDKVVTEMLNKARMLRTIVQNEKKILEQMILDYLGETAKREGEEWVGGTTLWNFRMNESVTIKIHKCFTFDEKLQIAKQKIDKCIGAWSQGSNGKLVALVNRAFKVDAKGEVDARQIIGLRQLDITDPDWVDAMNLIAESQKVQSTKTYFYFQEADESGKMKTVVLDFAAL